MLAGSARLTSITTESCSTRRPLHSPFHAERCSCFGATGLASCCSHQAYPRHPLHSPYFSSGGATFSRRGPRLSQLLQPAESVIHSGLRKLHVTRELSEVQFRMLTTPSRHLAECRRKAVQLAIGFELLDGRRLAHPGTDGLADVCRLEVEAAVDLPAHFPQHADGFEFHHRAVRAHHREQPYDSVPVPDVDHGLAASHGDAGLNARAFDEPRDGRGP